MERSKLEGACCAINSVPMVAALDGTSSVSLPQADIMRSRAANTSRQLTWGRCLIGEKLVGVNLSTRDLQYDTLKERVLDTRPR